MSIRVGLLYVDNFEQDRSRNVGSLGIAYIAAYLEKYDANIEVKIGIYPKDLFGFAPQIIGISAYSETLLVAVDYAQTCQQLFPDVHTVLGGPHIASNPLDLPEPFDVGVAGEGEEVFLKLCQLYGAKAFHPKSFQQIQGLTWRESDQIKNTGRCPSIQNMDSLAHPDRAKMYAAMRVHFHDFSPVIHIHTARGCPFRCTFCSAPLVNPKWRFHSPEWVIEELEIIAHDFPECREITLSDDLFTLKKSRLEGLAQAIREAGFHRRFFFFCSSRSNTLTPEMCDLLKSMNILMVSFGFESGSDPVIKQLKGGGTSRSDYERVLALCQSHGIYAHGNFIIGDQHETRSDLFQTYRFVLLHQDQLASVYFSHMTPFPGTKVWADAEENELIPDDLDYRVLNLEYEKGRSVFLNQVYSEGFYEPAFQQFKHLTTQMNDRYYSEQVLAKDMIWQERHDVPLQLKRLKEYMQWDKMGVLDGADFHDFDLDLIPCPTQDPEGLSLLGLDALFLPHSLERTSDPKGLIGSLPRVPIVSLIYNMGNFYELMLLLQNRWEEGVYGPRQRQYLSKWTLGSLGRAFQTHGYTMQSHFKMNYSDGLCPPGIIQFLEGSFQAKDIRVFAYLVVFIPGDPAKV